MNLTEAAAASAAAAPRPFSAEATCGFKSRRCVNGATCRRDSDPMTWSMDTAPAAASA